MNATPPDGAFRIEELLADVIAGLIGDAGHVAVGMASPIPAMGALLARQRAGGRPLVSVLQGQTAFTDGGRELFDCAGQGRLDVFFLSGAQIDGQANINLVCTGDYHHPQARFAGSFGSSYLAFVVPRVILFRLEHTPRTLVEKVDFISAPGTSPPGIYRPGGPVALITSRCLFAFDRPRGRFRLERLHPGHTLEEIVGSTGFSFDVPDIIPTTTPPSVETLRLLREVVALEIADIYPQFAASVFGPTANRENAHESAARREAAIDPAP